MLRFLFLCIVLSSSCSAIKITNFTQTKCTSSKNYTVTYADDMSFEIQETSVKIWRSIAINDEVYDPLIVALSTKVCSESGSFCRPLGQIQISNMCQKLAKISMQMSEFVGHTEPPFTCPMKKVLCYQKLSVRLIYGSEINFRE
jgi:hypothetical protein